MDLTILVLICIVYAMLMFFDFFFKSCMMLPYINFLEATGISVNFFRIRIHTNSFTRFIVRMSSKIPSLYRNSFKFGFYITMILFPIATCLMVISLFNNGSSETTNLPSSSSSSGSSSADDFAHLEILLPGVNLPLNQIGYYILALLICSVVHEAGNVLK